MLLSLKKGKELTKTSTKKMVAGLAHKKCLIKQEKKQINKQKITNILT